MFWYSILSWVDNIFFTLVRDCFKIILYLADVEIFNESIINDFSKRVYMLLAVIMFFKIAVSTIQYLVDPDKLSDNSSGVGAILKNSAIAIVLLVVVPEVFRFARTAQTEVASYIPSLIMGDSYGTTQGQSNVQRVTKEADNMTSTVMKIFYTPKTNKTDFSHGKEIKLETFKQQITDGCTKFDLLNLGDYFATDSCSWNYTIILPVVVAGLMIFVLVSMAVDIAIRAIKFALLEIMAPIPIVSYIDKGGKGAFESWIKEVKDVYLDLFIRIAVVYFIIFIIDKVVNNFNAGEMLKHMNGESVFVKGLVLVFIIIGLLLFGKEAPKYLCDALGIKGTDKISPMFKRAGGLLGAAASGLTAGYGNLANARGALSKDWAKWSTGRKIRESLKAAASAGAGMTSGMYRGTRSAFSGKSLKEAFSTGHRGATTARQNRELDRLNDIHFADRMKARYQDFLGLDTDESLAETTQKAYSTLHSDVAAFKKAVMGRIDKNASVALRNTVKANSAIDQLGQALAADNDIIDKLADDNPLKSIRAKLVFDKSKGAWKLKDNAVIGYHDLEGIRGAAEQAGLITTSGSMEAIKTVAQKEIFSDSMAGRVKDRNGNFIDEMNFGDEGYLAEGKKRNTKAHSDITTAVQTARQHIAENAVSLNGGNYEEIQDWFEGKSAQHPGEDFGTLDDVFQRKSEDLSAQMSRSTAHLARESNKRRADNKDKK